MRRFSDLAGPLPGARGGVQQAGGQARRGAAGGHRDGGRARRTGRPAGDRDGHLQDAQGPGGVREVLQARTTCRS